MQMESKYCASSRVRFYVVRYCFHIRPVLAHQARYIGRFEKIGIFRFDLVMSYVFQAGQPGE